MSPAHGPDEPVVEESPNDGEPDLTLRALHQRIRQQEILAELGVTALQGADFDKLLAETARLTAEALRAEFCKVLEYIPVREPASWSGPASAGTEASSAKPASAPTSPRRQALRSAPASRSSPTISRTRSASARPRCSRSTASTAP